MNLHLSSQRSHSKVFFHVVPSPHTKGKGVKILPPRCRVPLEITFVLALVDPSQREDVDIVALGARDQDHKDLRKRGPHFLEAPFKAVSKNISYLTSFSFLLLEEVKAV